MTWSFYFKHALCMGSTRYFLKQLKSLLLTFSRSCLLFKQLFLNISPRLTEEEGERDRVRKGGCEGDGRGRKREAVREMGEGGREGGREKETERGRDFVPLFNLPQSSIHSRSHSTHSLSL